MITFKKVILVGTILTGFTASSWAMDGHDVPGALAGVVHAAGGARVADELSYGKVAAIADHAAAERIAQSNSMYMGGHSPSADSSKARLSELRASRPYPEIYDKVAAIADHAAAEGIAKSNSMYMGGHSPSADSAKARLSELKASRPYPEIYDKVAAIADHAAAEVIAQSNSMYMGGHSPSADSAKARLSELKASRPH